MTKRPVSPQDQSESNKRQRVEQATDGTSHSSSQLTQASVNDLAKDKLMTMETKAPGTIKRMAEAACGKGAEALNNIADSLGLLSKDELIDIETKTPGAIGLIAKAAVRGYPITLYNIAAVGAVGENPAALNRIADALGQLTKDELIDIETKTPGTIGLIAKAAPEDYVINHHPIALNNIATTLGLLSKDKLLDIETKAPGTIGNIARAAGAVKKNPAALNNIAGFLGLLTKDELIALESNKHGTISYIVQAATIPNDTSPTPLNNIAAALGQLTKDELIVIESNFPDTITEISLAADCGYPSALDHIAVTLGLVTEAWDNDLIGQEAIGYIACAAINGHPDALNSIANILGQIDITYIKDEMNIILKAAVAGHPKAFLAILDHFFTVENDKPKQILTKCIQDCIRKGEYGRGLSIVTVLAKIKDRCPSFFKEICTKKKFNQVIDWYNSITALKTFDDILDYIKTTILIKYRNRGSGLAFQFLSKLIEFYEESNPIVCDELDLTVFIQKIKRYQSQYKNGTHSNKESVEKQLEDFMAPTSEHVVANNGLFSEHYCALRGKYKTLVLINRSAGGLLQLKQCKTLSDAHDEIVELFRHFMQCLQNSLFGRQMTFCYDDIDNFLRRYHFGEARQLLLADLQYLDRHHPQHALFKAHS